MAEGKSTLMKVIAEEQPIDDGERVLQKGAVIGRLEQEVPRHLSGRVFDVVAEGAGELAEVVKAYHEASEALAHSADDETFAKLEKAQQALEANDGWNLNSLIEQVISRMQLNPEADFSGLSGGMKRRVLLARVLVNSQIFCCSMSRPTISMWNLLHGSKSSLRPGRVRSFLSPTTVVSCVR